MSDFQNTLYTNDNLFVLNGLNSESVDLIYLDPPFNTKRLFSAPVGSKAEGSSFKDMWTWADVNEAYLAKLNLQYPDLMDFVIGVGSIHSKAMAAYLIYMAQRIVEMHRILKDTGSLCLHCDPTASHYLKIVLDEIFGKNNFRNEIVWCYNKWSNKILGFQKNHDIILFYSKNSGNNTKFNILHNPNSANDKTERRNKGYTTNTVKDNGKRISQLIVYDEEKAKKVVNSGKYDRVVYKKENLIPMPDWWEISILNSQSKERTGYPTQKPLALLHRIVKALSNPGDIVLDPFCGCATTCVAAQQLDRKWLGIDIEKQAVRILIDRLSDDSGMFKDFVNTGIIPQRTDITMKLPSQSVKERLYKEQNGICNGCGERFDIQSLEIDHIIPKSKGGEDYYENYQLLCGLCNRMKEASPMEYLLNSIKLRTAELDKRIFGE